MEIVGLIFLVLLIIIAFILLGIGGWFISLLGSLFDFLLEGVTKSLGCLIYVIAFIIALCILASL